MAKLEAQMDAVGLNIQRNHEDATEWREKTGKDVADIKATMHGLTSLVDQAKGASWLAGILLTGMGALALLGLKTVAEWLLPHL